MKRSFSLLLFSLLITFGVSHSFQSPSLEAPSDRAASKNGEVPLYPTNEGGFYLYVDLINKNNSNNSLQAVPSSVPMIPVFYTTETLLAKNCLNFSTYNCDDYDCILYDKSQAHLDLLNFAADAHPAKTHVYLDYNNWNLKSFALVAHTCQTTGPESLGSDFYGILGLGADSDDPGSNTNYIGAQEFSIYLENDRKSGKMLFGWDPYYAESETPVVTLMADEEWQVPNVYLLYIGDEFAPADGNKLMFDLSTEFIRVPYKLYESIIELLSTHFQVNCSSTNESVLTCGLNNKINSLPNITILVGAKHVELPPQLYVKDGFNDSVYVENITLNIQATSSTPGKGFYVSPAFEKKIILGNAFLRYFYTKFDVSINKISIFQKQQTGSNLAVIGLLALLFLGAAVGFGMKCFKKKENHNNKAPSINRGNRSANKVPLLVN